jgi:hypothetical protein
MGLGFKILKKSQKKETFLTFFSIKTVYSNNKKIYTLIRTKMKYSRMIEKIKSTCFTFIHEVEVIVFWYSIKKKINEVPKVFD